MDTSGGYSATFSVGGKSLQTTIGVTKSEIGGVAIQAQGRVTVGKVTGT